MRSLNDLAASILVPLFLATATPPAAAAPDLSWTRDRDTVALVDGKGEVIWRFNHAATQRMPYFHPVAMPGIPSLSWLSPPDHAWHYGMWFAWKYLNGKIYWEFDPATGRQEGVIEWSNVKVTTREDHSARIEMDLAYHPHDDPKPVLLERRVVEVSAPVADGSYLFDWAMTFTAGDRKVEFERTPIPGQPGGVAWGGYAGLTFRFAGEFRDWKAVNAEDLRDLKGHGAPSAGCDFSGALGGKEVGVAMLDHPGNRVTPTPWYLAMDSGTPMACLIAAPIFHEGFTVDAGKGFTLRYRVAVHRGRWDAKRLGEEHRRFVKVAESAAVTPTSRGAR